MFASRIGTTRRQGKGPDRGQQPGGGGGGGGGGSAGSSSTSKFCQKCESTRHATFECQTKSRPYKSRPTASMALLNPSAAKKRLPSVEVPKEFTSKQGGAGPSKPGFSGKQASGSSSRDKASGQGSSSSKKQRSEEGSSSARPRRRSSPSASSLALVGPPATQTEIIFVVIFIFFPSQTRIEEARAILLVLIVGLFPPPVPTWAPSLALAGIVTFFCFFCFSPPPASQSVVVQLGVSFAFPPGACFWNSSGPGSKRRRHEPHSAPQRRQPRIVNDKISRLSASKPPLLVITSASFDLW
ncbi:hypothetical protein OC834_006762 [Tilletia horrida]|nr:hypothetical protein OC834_006762 [Tilletia horrida]